LSSNLSDKDEIRAARAKSATAAAAASTLTADTHRPNDDADSDSEANNDEDDEAIGPTLDFQDDNTINSASDINSLMPVSHECTMTHGSKVSCLQI
jgi:hypothetical protein